MFSLLSIIHPDEILHSQYFLKNETFTFYCRRLKLWCWAIKMLLKTPCMNRSVNKKQQRYCSTDSCCKLRTYFLICVGYLAHSSIMRLLDEDVWECVHTNVWQHQSSISIDWDCGVCMRKRYHDTRVSSSVAPERRVKCCTKLSSYEINSFWI